MGIKVVGAWDKFLVLPGGLTLVVVQPLYPKLHTFRSRSGAHNAENGASLKPISLLENPAETGRIVL